MRQFLKRILAFSLLQIIVICGVILYAPYSKEYGYSYMDKDGRNLNWIYRRIHADKPIDIAFLGSSRTLNAINDSLLSVFYNNSSEEALLPVNLAISWMGRNLQYILLKDLLENKKPKLIAIEVRERESPFGHIGFPLVAHGHQIVFPASYANFKLIRDIFLATKARLDYTKQTLLYGKNPDVKILLDSYFGFEQNVDNITLDELERRKLEYERKHIYLENKFIRHLAFRFNKRYLNKIFKLARKKDIAIIFVYIPHYNTSKEKPLEYEFYAKYGEVLVPPLKLFSSPENFSNLTHLNNKGAILYTEWLYSKLYPK